jgi:hypothetical protein
LHLSKFKNIFAEKMKSFTGQSNLQVHQSSLVGAIAPILFLLITQLVFMVGASLIGRSHTPLESLIYLTLVGVCCLLILSFLSRGSLFGFRILPILGIAFVLRIAVGTWHYLTFFDPGYFEGPKPYSFLWDFEWFNENLVLVSNIWNSEGLFASLPTAYWAENKNPILTAYTAIGYYASGTNILTIAVWNSLHVIYTAYLIGALSSNLGASRRQSLFAMALVAFQPFGIISSTLARDFVGQTWLAIGVYLVIVLIKWRLLWLLAIPVACALAMSVRQPYLAVILSGSVIGFILHRKQSFGSKGLFVLVFTTIILITGLGDFVFNAAFGRFIDNQILVDTNRILLMPFRILRGLMGPFPWFQVFRENPPTGVEIMPIDFLQAIFNLTIYILVVPRLWKTLRLKKTIDTASLFALLFFLGGCWSIGIHMSYASIGIVFFLPFACRASVPVWCKSVAYSAAFFVVANFGYWAFDLVGKGLLQGLSGGY